LGFSFNIAATAETSDFKFGMQLGFAKAHHKIPPEEKEDVALGCGSFQKFRVFPVIFMQWLKVLTSNLVYSLGGQLGPSHIHTDDKSRPRSRHATFFTKLGIPLISFCNG